MIPQMVASHLIAFAVGPFSKMNLSDLREYEEDDLNNIRAAVDIFGYCLPGRDPELRNSSLFMSKVSLSGDTWVTVGHGPFRQRIWIISLLDVQVMFRRRCPSTSPSICVHHHLQ